MTYVTGASQTGPIHKCLSHKELLTGELNKYDKEFYSLVKNKRKIQSVIKRSLISDQPNFLESQPSGLEPIEH